MARLYRWLTESTIWHYVDERGYISAHFVHVRRVWRRVWRAFILLTVACVYSIDSSVRLFD